MSEVSSDSAARRTAGALDEPKAVVIPGMFLEGILQASGHALQICGPETGHSVRDIAFFSDAHRASAVARALNCHDDLVEALKAYEQWEAHVIKSDDCWRSVDGFAKITRPLWDRLVEIQGMRNAAIAKADANDGKASAPQASAERAARANTKDHP